MRISYKNGNMKYKLKIQKTFEKEAKRLGKRYPSLIEDIKHLGKEILGNPHLGIDLGGGLRKIRMAITSKGRGKSGGERVITFSVVVAVEETDINLLFIYDKAERASITKNEILDLLKKNGLK